MKTSKLFTVAMTALALMGVGITTARAESDTSSLFDSISDGIHDYGRYLPTLDLGANRNIGVQITQTTLDGSEAVSAVKDPEFPPTCEEAADKAYQDCLDQVAQMEHSYSKYLAEKACGSRHTYDLIFCAKIP